MKRCSYNPELTEMDKKLDQTITKYDLAQALPLSGRVVKNFKANLSSRMSK
jgi:hypothetical protein